MKLFTTTLIYYLAAGLNFFVAFLQYSQNHNIVLAGVYLCIGVVFLSVGSIYDRKMKEKQQADKKAAEKAAKKQAQPGGGQKKKKK